MNEWNPYSLMTVTPFECPNVKLAYSLYRAGAFSILDIGYDSEAGVRSMKTLSGLIDDEFGIRIPSGICIPTEEIPENVSLIILSDTEQIHLFSEKKCIIQVTDEASALKAESSGAWAVIAKGNESGGQVGSLSSFILFQRLLNRLNVPVFLQGGVGLHTTPAVLAAGGAGVVFDSQLALLQEAGLPKSLRSIIRKLDGTETKIFKDQRILIRPDSPDTDTLKTDADIISRYGGFDLKENFIPMGQDVAIANTIHGRAKTAGDFVFLIRESVYAHIRQAKKLDPFGNTSLFAMENNLKYPVAQGPMSSISDNPDFAFAIADNGGLPFIALSTLTGSGAEYLVKKTAERLGEKNWGVGLLGFLPKEILSEQLGYIYEAKPGYALIAGGRPSQAKQLEKEGIKTFLHVPSPGLLDLFLKEGARNFVFEGRECGGHIGPLSSFVLWEQQIERLLAFDRPEELSLLIAGGIHDALSASLIAIMTAPLTARGAKIALLMGTSYLYTEEAVRTGALLKRYQEKALQNSETHVLTTAPGHETRCLGSRYLDHFESVKKELIEQSGKGEAVWQTLEQMNMGRLQIAARGKKWVDQKIIDVNETTQEAEGLYMIGQIACLRESTTTVEQLHRAVTRETTPLIAAAVQPPYPKKNALSDDIAIIGMASILPGSENNAAYWKNILTGKNLVTEVPDIRWNKEIYYDPEAKNPESGLAGKKSNTKWGAFLPDIYFDPLEYGIPPQSLASIDPIQLLSLKAASDALEDAGYTKEDEFDRENLSVIFGTEAGTDLGGAYGLRNILPQYFGEIPDALDDVLPVLTEDSFPGVLGNIISGRIANRLDLGGRNYTVDAACASSMAAIDSACNELLTGNANMVIAGGADSHNSINDYLMFSSLYTLADGDRSRPFDAETDGLCMGEGVAAVVMKRYADAVADGDRIYCLIKGVGGASDGRSLGLTAPRKEGQVRALTRAYAQAGIPASDVGLIEAHGTGTVVGDKTELASLTETFSRAGATAGTCTLSAVKSQIGHTKCAAGMAGLIKTALSVYHGVLPPIINLETANAYYHQKTSPFVFSSMARPWLSDRRIAGISAFGFGGTNFHVVVENCDSSDVPFTSLVEWPAELILIRGDNPETIATTLDRLDQLITLRPDIRLRDIALTLSLKKEPVYAVIVAENCSELKSRLAVCRAGSAHPDIHYVKPVSGKTAFMFAGQGSQRPGMLADLFVCFPFLRRYLKPLGELGCILFPEDAFTSERESLRVNAVKDTINAQPLLGAAGIAMAELLKAFGIEPDMVGGHSYGEIPALCFSGVLDPEDLIPVSRNRAVAILDSVEGEAGKMAAVIGEKEAVESVLSEIPGIVTANYNSPKQYVIAGESERVDSALSVLKTAGITAREIPVACAFHSPVIQKAEPLFKTFLDSVEFRKSSVPVWSNTTAKPYPETAEEIRARLARHLVQPVRFVDQIRAMEEDGAAVFIEVGPGSVLTGLINDTIGETHVAFSTDTKGVNGVRALMNSLARYIATGRSFNIEKLFEDRDAVQLDIENPEQYRLSPAVWRLNGQMSLPINGKLPANAMKPVETPFALSGVGGLRSAALDDRDETVNTYLNNVRDIMAAQRDVMLGYLGVDGGSRVEFIRDEREVRKTESLETEAVAPAAGSGSGKPLKELLLDIVAERTGYPTEMLEMTLDLEADLSIDSIKRIEIIGELNAQLGIEISEDDDAMQEAMEELAAIKTLEGIIGWLEEKGVGGDSEQSPAGMTRLSRETIQDSLIGIVALKTGYPEEMLELTLDLEADLSIDSIKRIEILGELNQQLSLVDEDEGDQEKAMEELAAIKTLEGIIGWLCEKVEAGGSGEAPETSLDTEAATSVSVPTLALNRYKAVLSDAPETGKTEQVLDKKTFLLTNDTLGIAEKLSKTLTRQGARVHIVDKPGDRVVTEKTDGLIHLSPLSGKEDLYSAIDFFGLVKQLNPEDVKWVYGVSGLGGSFGETVSNDDSLQNYQGLAGFIKTLSREWHRTRCRYIDLDTSANKNSLVSQILDELTFDDTTCEVAYANGARRIYNIEARALQKGPAPSIELDKDSVILALGGGKGITSEIVLKLSQMYGCRFILVGRSEPESADEEPVFRGITDAIGLRKALIEQGEIKKPAEIEAKVKKILSDRALKKTLKAIEDTGGSYEYVSLDATDAIALTELVRKLYETYGRIDGVLHGAGIIDDKYISQKSESSFARVFKTKVVPAIVLSETLRDDVRFVSFFSSISSAFGNRGQIDYSSANDTLDKLAIKMNNRIKGRAFSINWGPWGGQGMVSEELSREYAKAGIGLIPPDEGAEALIDEIIYGRKETARLIIMSGSPETMLLQGEVVHG